MARSVLSPYSYQEVPEPSTLLLLGHGSGRSWAATPAKAVGEAGRAIEPWATLGVARGVYGP